MAWPATTADDVRSGKGAKTLGQAMYDRKALVASVGWSWVGPAQTMTASLIDEYNLMVLMPVWAEATATISCDFGAYQSGGSGNANFRLRAREEGGTWVNGSTLNQALTSSYVVYTVTVDVPASPSWTDTRVELGLQAQAGTGGTWTVSLENITGNLSVTPV